MNGNGGDLFGDNHEQEALTNVRNGLLSLTNQLKEQKRSTKESADELIKVKKLLNETRDDVHSLILLVRNFSEKNAELLTQKGIGSITERAEVILTRQYFKQKQCENPNLVRETSIDGDKDENISVQQPLADEIDRLKQGYACMGVRVQQYREQNKLIHGQLDTVKDMLAEAVNDLKMLSGVVRDIFINRLEAQRRS